jgi:hypothetical protein
MNYKQTRAFYSFSWHLHLDADASTQQRTGSQVLRATGATGECSQLSS